MARPPERRRLCPLKAKLRLQLGGRHLLHRLFPGRRGADEDAREDELLVMSEFVPDPPEMKALFERQGLNAAWLELHAKSRLFSNDGKGFD